MGRDRLRFEALYREHAGAVAAYALRRTTREIAEEIVAETFLVAWRRLDDVPANALPWLYGVARRTLANQRRALVRRDALKQRLRLELRVAVPLVQRADTPALEALSRLKLRDREALMLIGWEGLRPSEAAEVVRCSPATFRLRLHRARRRFARELEPPKVPAAATIDPRTKEAK